MHPWICLTSMPAIAEPPSRLSTSLGTCSEYIACTLSVLTWHAFLPLWFPIVSSAHIFSCVAPRLKNKLTISLSSLPNTNLLHRFSFFQRVFLCVFVEYKSTRKEIPQHTDPHIQGTQTHGAKTWNILLGATDIIARLQGSDHLVVVMDHGEERKHQRTHVWGGKVVESVPWAKSKVPFIIIIIIIDLRQVSSQEFNGFS